MRGVGRTQNLIDILPDERCVVITASHTLGKEIKRRIEEERGKELAKKVKFVSVPDCDSVKSLFGFSVPVFFDHSFFDMVDIETAKKALEVSHSSAVVYHHHKGKLK